MGVAQQLEKATTNNYCLEEQWFGNHFNPCHNHFLKLVPQHCLSRVRSPLRLGGLGGQDGTDAFGHKLTRVHRCLPFDWSTVGAISYRGMLLTLESIDLMVSELF